MEVAWTARALDDLDAIQDFIAEDDPATAFRFTQSLLRRTGELLSFNPMLGRQGRVAETREWVMPRTAYIVVYRVRARVEILAVVHGARDWPAGF